jgi:hypothetical protein
MTMINTAVDPHPMAFVNMANEYCAAANALLELSEQRPKKVNRQSEFNDPTYFLYFHTIELALKAYLRSHDLPILGTPRMNHELLKLYEECRSLGLGIGPDDRVDIRNIVGLLESSNEFQGLRYFNLQQRSLPGLDWTRETVGALLEEVAARVEQVFPGSNIPGPAVKADFIFTIRKAQAKPDE